MNQRDSKYRHENGRRGVPAALSGLTRVGREGYQGSASGSTLGYIPAAASRLKAAAIYSDARATHNTIERYFWKISLVYSRSFSGIGFAGTLSDDLCESEAGWADVQFAPRPIKLAPLPF